MNNKKKKTTIIEHYRFIFMYNILCSMNVEYIKLPNWKTNCDLQYLNKDTIKE